jgi:hypothetical protein
MAADSHTASPESHEPVVRLIRMLAHARRFDIQGKALRDIQDMNLDPAEDVREFLMGICAEDVEKEEPDHSIPDKRAVVFRKAFEGRSLYVKVSVRIEKDHDMVVLSCKPRRADG